MNRTKQGSLFSDSTPTAGGFNGLDGSGLTIPAEEQRLMIRASAGTGKTFQLANRFVSLLRTSPPDRILASTFTRKAAGEILDRILLRLAKAVISEDDFHSLQEFAGDPKLQREECARLLTNLTSHLHRLRVGTLDGFFSRLATCFSLELQLPPNWRMIDDLEASQLREEAINSVLHAGEVQELRTLVTQIASGNPGRSVHSVILDAIGDFYGIYCDSTGEAWRPFGDLKPPSQAEWDAATERLLTLPLSEKRLETARQGDLKRVENQDWAGMLSSGLLMKAVNDETYYRKPLPDDLKQVYLEIFALIRRHELFIWGRKTEATYELIEKFDVEYRRLKRQRGGLEFNDVTRCLAQSLGEKATSDLTHRLDGRIDHLLLDEFQDTSPDQWNVLYPFARDAVGADGKSFFCVGDAKQAIYGWRGGEAAIFDTLASQLSGLTQKPLNKSFRSSPVVIDAVNQIFRGMIAHDNFDREMKTIQNWSGAFPEHATARTELPGHFCLRTSPDKNEDGEDLRGQLFEYVAQLAKETLEKHPQGTIGILTRKNDAIGQIIFELNRLGVDASEEGGNPLTDSAAVQLLLSLFQLADHPGHTIALFHVANSPLGRIVNLSPDDSEEDVHRFAERLREKLVQRGYGDFISSLVPQLAVHCSRRELRRLIQMTSLADQFDTLPHTLRPSEFVEFIENQKVKEPTDSRVRVMSIHQSKGLQFDTVIFAEADGSWSTPAPKFYSLRSHPTEPAEVVVTARRLEDQPLFPTGVRRAFEQTIERDITGQLCLLYVALTRAIHNLQVVVQPCKPTSKESSLPKTFAGILRAALAPDKRRTPETILYESGDPNWFAGLARKVEKPKDKPALQTLTKVEFVKKSTVRNLARVSPSQSKKSPRVPMKTVLPTTKSRGRERGTLIHAWMEQVVWIENQPPEDVMRRSSIAYSFSSQELDGVYADFLRMLQRSEVRKLLSDAEYRASVYSLFPEKLQETIQSKDVVIEVRNERRFSVPDRNGLLVGSLDRLVTFRVDGQVVAADIIDFKTDGIGNDVIEFEDRMQVYRPQLRSYRRAVEKLYGIPQECIAARIVLLAAGRVIEVDP
ncbi:UvrD-helicase domain-containing protein [Thalassoglobus sp. JC818]|uniref:UvrD-helicase domain-containing protein n=1 Tax=Thalassoglobus sp. JC818 TaxID=3232136 RepID=UPI00345A75AE